MSFELKSMLINRAAVGAGTININTATSDGGIPAATYLFHNKTPYEGYPVGVKVQGPAGTQCVLTLQESVDGTTALSGGSSVVLTVTAAQGYGVTRFRGNGLAQYVIGTAVTSGGTIAKLEIGWALNDANLP